MSLRNDVIKLAYANPDLRTHLLPLIKTSGFDFSPANLVSILDDAYFFLNNYITLIEDLREDYKSTRKYVRIEAQRNADQKLASIQDVFLQMLIIAKKLGKSLESGEEPDSRKVQTIMRQSENQYAKVKSAHKSLFKIFGTMSLGAESVQKKLKDLKYVFYEVEEYSDPSGWRRFL